MAAATDGAWFDATKADELVLELLAEAQRDGTAATALGAVTPMAPGFSSMIGPVPVVEEHEAARLGEALNHACTQLRELGAPGIVILDSSQDPGIMGRCCDVAALMSEPWARELACALMVASARPGFAMTVVPGPRYNDFAAAAPTGLRVCPRKHVHVDSFGQDPLMCELVEGFEDYPPFCVPGSGHFAPG